jgi:murein DD-endopeptidase MepM/ murein hydrolase activator NlpD
MHLSDKFNNLSAKTKSKAQDIMKSTMAAASASRVISFGALFFAVCAVGAVGVAPLAPDVSDIPVRTVVQELTLQSEDVSTEEVIPQVQHYIKEEKILRGDRLATLLMRLGVDDAAASNFIKTDEVARGVMSAKAGRSIRAKTSEDGKLVWLRVGVGDTGDKDDEISKTLLIQHDEQGQFLASVVDEQLERRVEMRSGEIQSSLFAATDKAEIPSTIETQMLRMFETNVDFRRLQRGDYFNVVYETYWQNGELVKNGRLISGEFRNSGKLFQAVWFDEGSGAGGYYSFDGKSLKKAFLKSPLEFSRVSSGFSMRVHPISGKWKRHTGIDFAAVSGTPIRASADGVIEHAGPKGGYGNMVIVKHWSNYTTAYAHMSRFAKGMRKGSRVSQGEVIGYVGSTGWSTGPHLHYEFRVNNVPKDPNSISIPSAVQLASHDLPKFRNVATEMSHRFSLLRPERNTNIGMVAK